MSPDRSLNRRQLWISPFQALFCRNSHHKLQNNVLKFQEYLNEELYYRNPEKEKKLHVVEPASTQDSADATNETVAPEQATAVSE